MLSTLAAAEPTGSGPPVHAKVAEASLVATGQAAPDFTCQTTEGRSLTLSALRGKVVVLYFFSTHSLSASAAELRYLETEIAQKLKHRSDFQLIAIGRGHQREELVRLGGENHLSFALVPDPQAAVYSRYFTKYVPRTTVVRADGSIAYLASGFYEYEGILRLQVVLEKELRQQTR